MSPATLLVRCKAPLQSWGTRSRFDDRDTGTEPSKSGIVGVLAAALGRPRDADMSDLAGLFMAVRLDRPGTVVSDFQTVGGGDWNGQPYHVSLPSGKPGNTALATAYFIADASFLVALEGDRAFLESLHYALQNPVWPLCLGRRAFPPALPMWLPCGVQDGDALSVLRSVEWPGTAVGEGPVVPSVRAVVDCRPGEDGDFRQDVPISFVSTRRVYGRRRVRTVWLTPSEGACSSPA